MMLNEQYKKRLNELAGIISKDHLINDINKFVKNEFYSSVNYEDLLFNCDLSKGNCWDVTENLEKFLIGLGYTDVQQIDLYHPLFDLSQAHPEWTQYEPKWLFHVILRVGEFYVDLTGSQFSPEMAGVKIYTKLQLKSLWKYYEVGKVKKDGFLKKVRKRF